MYTVFVSALVTVAIVAVAVNWDRIRDMFPATVVKDRPANLRKSSRGIGRKVVDDLGAADYVQHERNRRDAARGIVRTRRSVATAQKAWKLTPKELKDIESEMTESEKESDDEIVDD
jgi:hypothetical protein